MEFELNGYDPFTHDGSFFYDEAAAEKPLAFAEKCLTHTKGEFARKPLILHPQHADYVRALFGFKHKETKLRRYRTTLYSAARGNAKTTLSSLLAHYLTYCDGEGGAETYLCASTAKQSAINFDIIKQQVVQSAKLRSRLEINESRSRILYRKNNSFCCSVSSEAGGAHGWNTQCCICDEVKNWRGQQGRDFWGAIETSMGKRRQPLLYISSTQSYEREGIWFDLYTYAKRVKEKPDVDFSFLPFIFELDAKDDWTNLEHIKKANPLWGTGVQPDYIKRMVAKAQTVASFENEFKREHCNLLVEQNNRFIKMQDWFACPQHDLDVANEWCVAALDTSSTKDLTALALYWPKSKYLRVWFWIPGESARQRSMRDGVDYESWIRNPLCNITFTKSKRIERDTIVSKIMELKGKYKLTGIAFDPWEGRVGLADDLHKKGIRMIEHGQSYSAMNAPTKQLEVLIATHELNKGNNPLLDWNFSNLCVQEHPNGFIRPVKPQEQAKRIDGCVATIMALGISKAITPVTIT
ncbi:terminase large subunit [Anatilimnocola floriformis]|uniref:terminase large subunit n=1 Tax=Anatilimnocola floriformis TaxID=2948575 RepID=UPI0020C1C9FA|nr:terminase TerL endonuclease subunit [Anatilimnocola floriformis]